MKATIESMDEWQYVNGALCRVWCGVTEGGVEFYAFIRAVAVRSDSDTRDFEAELNPAGEPDLTSVRVN